MSHRREVALEVNRDHGVELVFAGIGEHPVTDDARVVYQDVQSAEGVDGRRNEAFGLRPVGDVGAAGDGFASRSGDFVDDTLAALPPPAGEPSRPTPMSFTTTRAPSAANASACARPIRHRHPSR